MYEVIHVKVPREWYDGLRRLAEECEGTINQQVRLAVRDRLARAAASRSTGRGLVRGDAGCDGPAPREGAEG